MRIYREFRGLDGELIRVPEDSFVTAPRCHAREPFPFVAIAKRLGAQRHEFAAATRHAPWIEDALKLSHVRRLLSG